MTATSQHIRITPALLSDKESWPQFMKDACNVYLPSQAIGPIPIKDSDGLFVIMDGVSKWCEPGDILLEVAPQRKVDPPRVGRVRDFEWPNYPGDSITT